MAGYFDYLGKVFTEKGSWYKILLITALQGIGFLFSPQESLKNATLGTIDFNIPGLILYILAMVLILGFTFQMYSAGMNNKQKLLPDIDFADMVIRVIRFIPFMLVWMFYWAVIGVTFAMLMPSASKSFLIIPLAVVLVVVVFILTLVMPAVVVLHARNFSYAHVLNPLTPFRIFSKVGGPIVLLGLLVVFLYLLLVGILFLFGMIIGVSASSENAASGGFVLIVLLVMYLYVYNAISFAYNHKLCDIVKSKLEETEYLDDDFAPVEESESDDEEDDAFAGYMHNKDDELDL